MSKSILNKLRPGVLWKKERRKTLWEAGTVFDILLAMERSGTPAKSQKMFKAGAALWKGRACQRPAAWQAASSLCWLGLPCHGAPGVFTLLPTSIQSLILPQLSFCLLKAGTGTGSIQSTHKWNYCCTSIVCVVTNMTHFRWAKVALFSTILTSTGQRWQALR